MQAASELIRSSVEPVLEQYTPAMLASLKFSKFTLGTVAPQFTGLDLLVAKATCLNSCDLRERNLKARVKCVFLKEFLS